MATVLLIILAAILSFLLTGAATWYAKRQGLLDHPGERHSHEVPTPRGGGAGIVLALFVFVMAGFAVGGVGAFRTGPFTALYVGIAVLALLGWWDDHHDLSAGFRFAVQLAVSIFLLSSFAKFGWVGNWVLGIAGVIFTAWMINLFNFMDGSNGMAAAQGLFAFAVLSWLFYLAGDISGAVLSLVLTGCCAGFLPWNLGKARVFMGDVGSLALGFAIAGLLVYGAGSGAFSLPVALMVMSLFLADGTLTLLRRILNGERWYNAHRQHLYQRIIARGWSHGGVLYLYQAINLVLVLPGIVIGVNHPDWAWPIALVMGLVLGLGWYLSITRIGVLAEAG